MVIGKAPGMGEALEIGRWHFWIDVRACPPQMFRAFKPYLFVGLLKIIDAGEPYKLDGRPMVKKGGWWAGSFPWGIAVEIIRSRGY